jgi:hypothetical protein
MTLTGFNVPSSYMHKKGQNLYSYLLLECSLSVSLSLSLSLKKNKKKEETKNENIRDSPRLGLVQGAYFPLQAFLTPIAYSTPTAYLALPIIYLPSPYIFHLSILLLPLLLASSASLTPLPSPHHVKHHCTPRAIHHHLLI